MALTQISTAGVKDNAVTAGKIPANAVGSSELADNAVDTAAIANNAVNSDKIATNAVNTTEIADTAVTLAKLEHGTSSNNGKFLRANNGADPSFETVSTDLVGDTSPQLGGNLDVNGKNIILGDSSASTDDRIQIGDSADLQIYHDGSHSIIRESGTGNLALQSNQIVMESADGGETMAKFIDDGAVELRHNNTTRLETTSDGNYYYGTITGGASARSNAGITQANVHTPVARFYTGGYANGDQSLNIQGTTGNWSAGVSSTAHRSSGLLFCRTLSNTQHIRAGIQHDMHGTEKFKFHTSYGDIHFRTRNGNNGNQAWEDCDRDPLIMHHNGHVAMMHMPRALMAVGSDNSSYSTDMSVHTIQGSVTLHAGITHSNGVFTVPYQGVYSVHANVGIHTNSSNTQRLDMVVNGSNWQRTEHAGHSGWQTQHITHVLELAANNTIEFRCAGRYDGSPFGRITICMLHGTLTT